MTHQTQELVTQFSELILETYGDHTSFEQISGFELSSATSLVFIQDVDQFSLESAPAVIVTSTTTATQLVDVFHGFIIGVKDVKLAQAKIKQHYQDYQVHDDEWPSIHPSAVIHPSTKIGQHSRIGPNVTIGANCDIGENVIIRANAVIEHDVVIGSGSVINSLSNIGYECQLGQNVTIQSGCIIGNEGYGFASDQDGKHHRVPHTGNVLLHDNVHIGSNCCIDRGTYGSTIIAQGVKIDNLCHIAHNVEIGENSLITAQCVIAGSSIIGKRVIMSGQVGVLDHKVVHDDSILLHRAGVTEDLPHGGMWAGTPAKPFKEYVRDLAASKKVIRLQKEVKQLKKLIDQ